MMVPFLAYSRTLQRLGVKQRVVRNEMVFGTVALVIHVACVDQLQLGLPASVRDPISFRG